MSKHLSRLGYCQYLLTSSTNYTLTNFSNHVDDMSHDAITRYLRVERLTPRMVWDNVRTQVVAHADGCVLFDDTVLDKNHSHRIHFTPGLSLAGGLVIGLAAAALVMFNGRIAGISGIFGGLLTWPRNDVDWRVAFLAGLIGAPVIAGLLGKPAHADIDAGWGRILVAGFLVGVGTRYASGCTSGHGVCGLSRGSIRSLVATATFMVAGFLTVFVQRHLIGG